MKPSLMASLSLKNQPTHVAWSSTSENMNFQIQSLIKKNGKYSTWVSVNLGTHTPKTQLINTHTYTQRKETKTKQESMQLTFYNSIHLDYILMFTP